MGVPPKTAGPLPEGQRAQTEARPGRKACTEVRTIQWTVHPALAQPWGLCLHTSPGAPETVQCLLLQFSAKIPAYSI